MSLRNQTIYNIVMVLLSWLTIPLFKYRGIKRYLPASLLIVLFEAINVQVGKKRKWWIFYKKPNSYLFGEFPFNIGPFVVSSLWSLKLTYGDLRKFLLLNAAINAFFAFIYIKILKKLKIARLVKINQFQFFLYFYYKAFFLYGFQYVIENKSKFFKGYEQN